MAVQLSTAVRNATLDQIETTIGVSAILKVFSGALPANCAAADPAGVLATMTLPADWWANASGGAKALSGVWQDVSADGTGTPACFRIYDSGLAACHLQGTSGVGSGDMNWNGNFTAGQTATVNSFTLTAPGA